MPDGKFDTRLFPPVILSLFEESDKRRKFSDFKRTQERILSLHPLDEQSLANLKKEAKKYLEKTGSTLEEATEKYNSM